ncbi:MAG: hypothetical protein P4L38_12335, partial [Syntrophaceae bacterium]|nr:hypothetical protein [Syntrophaceae bacterium]
GNFDIFSNKYFVNDDVRQQIFWMERWRDPQLFQNDFLTNYAETYVPIGVKAIYRTASLWFDPLIFSNILTAILFALTAGLWFAWGRVFGDNLTAFLVVVVYFLFTGFQYQMNGGLSRSFVFPLMILYLLLVSRGNLFYAGLVLFIQPFFNPYVFLLCLFTHSLIMLIKFGPALASRIFPAFSNILGITNPEEQQEQTAPQIIKELLVLNAPVFLAVAFTIVSVAWYQSSTGHLISWREMVGKSEYSELGRYQLYPAPSFFHELIRPWIFNLSFPYWGPIAGWIMALLVVGVFSYAALNYRPLIKWRGLNGLLLLIPVSLLLYVLARLLLVKLFVPRRYIAYTLNLVYCIGFAVAIRVILEKMKLSKLRLYALVIALLAFACIKGRHIEIFDYSGGSNLYKFIQTTPKNALIAGWPEVMDNVMTFGERPAYVTYKLSHTWVEPYWSEVKRRTFDLFKAYYSSKPEEIRSFCKSNHIDYLIVRSEDFEPERLKKFPPYFEPFNGFIWYLTNSRNYFAALDKTVFPPIFEENGIRVLRFE